jgi:hypothetical protein
VHACTMGASASWNISEYFFGGGVGEGIGGENVIGEKGGLGIRGRGGTCVACVACTWVL